MATRTGSAAEFVLEFMQRQPERAWRASELHAASDGKWKADNFTETLKRLLVAGQVKKTIGAGRSVLWTAVTTAAPVLVSATTTPLPAKIASTTAVQQPAPVGAPTPVQPTGTAAQFIIDLLAKQPDLEWRVAEIVQASGSKWNEKVTYNTLTKLLVAGKVKKTVADRQAWWGIANANLGNVHPAKVAKLVPAAASALEKTPVPKPVPQPASSVPRSAKPAVTATEFVVSLLANKPEREWRIAEIVQAGGQEWNEANVYKSLARLSANGQVKKTMKGRTAWWSAAAMATKNSTPANVRVTAVPSLRVVQPAAREEPATAAKAAIPAPVPPPAASATKPALTCASAASFVVKLLRRLAKELLTRVADGKRAGSRSSKR